MHFSPIGVQVGTDLDLWKLNSTNTSAFNLFIFPPVIL